jgi:hypothetical protein
MPATFALLLAAGARKSPHREDPRPGSDPRPERSPAKARQETATGSPWAASFERS